MGIIHSVLLTAVCMCVGCVRVGMVQGAREQLDHWTFASSAGAAQVAYFPVRCLRPIHVVALNHSIHTSPPRLGLLGAVAM